VRLKYFATYRDVTRRIAEDVPAPPDVWALLLSLGERYPGLRAKLVTPDGTDIGAETIILVNGRNVCHLEGKNTKLADTDTVSIFPMVAGG